MTTILRRYLLLFALLTVVGPNAADLAPLRPPAVPLVTHHPYFSVWSFSDRLTDEWPRHWTGATQALCGLVRIDDQAYRIIGPEPAETPALHQTRLEVWPTRTVYQFDGGGVQLTLTFLSPLLPYDLELVSRPVSYLTWSARSTDQQPHRVEIYLDATAELAVNTPDQAVAWERQTLDDLQLMRVGTREQPVLARKGDNVRIDWGYFYLAAPGTASTVMTSARTARSSFVTQGKLPTTDDLEMPRPASDRWPVLACRLDLGRVERKPVERHLLLGYDELFAIEYFDQKLQPWWRRRGHGMDYALLQAERQYADLAKECEKFDRELFGDLRGCGGEAYARLASLAFRQCLAAHVLVADELRRPLYFSKENFSNGCIATVDVTYPSSPFFLLFNPRLLKGQLIPILEYAASDRWQFNFAPHDLGTYPIANGQVYGGGEKDAANQMPVEECGNMLLMAAAISELHGDVSFPLAHVPVLSEWAAYLRQYGLDPVDQLCTDDFAGHLARNANLSLKAILAVAAHARYARTFGNIPESEALRARAEEMAAEWMTLADDGDHYRLAFDQPNSWSMKYNLVWDQLLGLNLFPPEVRQREVAFYRTRMNRYGLPLDNRKDYTKTDWLVWTATLTEKQRDFEFFIQPLYDFVQVTPDRVPFTDWYDTVTARTVGFQARSVIGGVYLPLLEKRSIRNKWMKRARP